MRLCTSGLVLAASLGISFANEAEPVLKWPTILVRGAREDLSSLAVTDVDLTAPGAGANVVSLSDRFANFYVASSGAHSFNDTFALRGLTNTPIFGEPAVTFYLDEVPLGGGFTAPDVMAGVAQARLIRGPGQALLFGRAGPAGVVQWLTPEPRAEATGQIEGGTGNFSWREVEVSAGTARGSRVDASVAARYERRDGYVFNRTLSRDMDHSETSTGLAKVNFRPTHGFVLSLLALGERARDGEAPLVPLGGPMYVVDRKAEGRTDLDAFTGGLTAAFLAPEGRLTFTSSINEWKLGPYRTVLAFGPAELLNDVKLSQRNYNQELTWVSAESCALRWRGGLFYSQGRTNGAFARAFGPAVIEDSSYDIETKRLAAYGEASLDLSSGFTLVGGLRLERTEKSMDRVERAPVPQTFAISRTSGAFQPKVEIDYRARADLRLFSSIGAGFKPGGFSAFTGNRSLASFSPERTVAWEAGISLAAPKRHLSTTLRTFLYEIHGYQIERSFATGSSSDDYLVVNAPRARSAGAEWETAWSPFAGWSVSAEVGLTRVVLQEFTDPFSGRDYDGNHAPFVPRYDYALRLDYRPARGGFGGLTWSGNGRTDFTESEDPHFAQQPYGVLAAEIGWQFGRWRIAAAGENLLDRAYYRSISAGTGHGTPGLPRTKRLKLQRVF